MDFLALSNLDNQICSVMERIKVFQGDGKDSKALTAKTVLRSLVLTKSAVAQGFDLRAEAFISGSMITCSKVPGCEPILRRGDKSLPVSGHYVARVFIDAGAELFDYQIIHLDPELAADVIDESHARLLSQEEMFQRDLKTLRLARRETTWAMDAVVQFPADAASSRDAA